MRSIVSVRPFVFLHVFEPTNLLLDFCMSMGHNHQLAGDGKWRSLVKVKGYG